MALLLRPRLDQGRAHISSIQWLEASRMCVKSVMATCAISRASVGSLKGCETAVSLQSKREMDTSCTCS